MNHDVHIRYAGHATPVKESFYPLKGVMTYTLRTIVLKLFHWSKKDDQEK